MLKLGDGDGGGLFFGFNIFVWVRGRFYIFLFRTTGFFRFFLQFFFADCYRLVLFDYTHTHQIIQVFSPFISFFVF